MQFGSPTESSAMSRLSKDATPVPQTPEKENPRVAFFEGSSVTFGMSSEASTRTGSIAEDEPRETIESPLAGKSLKDSKGKGR